jgi:hypothetical protein
MIDTNLIIVWRKREKTMTKRTTMTQSELKEQTEAYFDLLHKNTIDLLRAKHRKETENIAKFSEEEAKLIREIQTSDVSDLFQDFLMSEFKEQLYEMMNFPHVSFLDTEYMYELERIVMEYYGENSLYEHVFVPSHFLYDDGKHYYMFYHFVEVNGNSILDQWYNDNDA